MVPNSGNELIGVAELFLHDALPHHGVPDSVYVEVAAKLAESVPDLVQLHTSRSQAASTADTRSLVQAAIPLFYGHLGTWSVTGFEGPSFDAGGYLTRGFNDLDWLPEPRVVESAQPLAEIGALIGPGGVS